MESVGITGNITLAVVHGTGTEKKVLVFVNDRNFLKVQFIRKCNNGICCRKKLVKIFISRFWDTTVYTHQKKARAWWKRSPEAEGSVTKASSWWRKRYPGHKLVKKGQVFNDMCQDWLISLVSKGKYLNHCESLFISDVARKAFKGQREFGTIADEKIRLCSLSSFDAFLTREIDSLNAGWAQDHFSNMNFISSCVHLKSLNTEPAVGSAYRKRGAGPQVYATESNGLLPVVATNLFRSCKQFFQNP